MSNLSVINGRLSPMYNHFSEFNIDKIVATDTRLMGVVALRIDWVHKEDPSRKFFQIIHLDFSEYGIDDYFEFELNPADPNLMQSEAEADFRFECMTNPMGGNLLEIPLEACICLIEKAHSVWEASKLSVGNHDINRPFRQVAIKRVKLMKRALTTDGSLAKVYKDVYSNDEILAFVSKKDLTIYETINYFVMRLADRDFDAASYLSSIPADELKACVISKKEVKSLIKNEISFDGNSYTCVAITLGEYSYYCTTLVLTVSQDETNRFKVASLSTGFHKELSMFEAATSSKRAEYLTVYEIDDMAMVNFDISKIDVMRGSVDSVTPNGWRFTKYKSHNSHVNKAEYHISGDIYASLLLTIGGELVIMSHEIMNITECEKSLQNSEYQGKVRLTGKYKTNSPIFQSLSDTTGAYLKDLVEEIDIGPR